jgi:hypothetical protein
VDIIKKTYWNVWKDEYLLYALKMIAEKPKKKLFNFRNWIYDQMKSKSLTDANVNEFINYSTI